ncbi:MAG: pantoate--beta-alanine ligase [Anaerolineales bacterium]|jgi:pantoate--beta-alanine ligase
MEIFKLKSDLISYLETVRSNGYKIGFTPTMGALHNGHMELVRASKKEADCTVCSIFVNPGQFNNPEDLLNYPRSYSQDIAKLKKEECDVVYAPDEDDLYDSPNKITIGFHLGTLGTILEGKYRSGHFKGVALVVVKLFNTIQPHFTYFGQKDLQQYYLVRNLIRDLSYNIQLRLIPTVREKDGLALSSRNRRIPGEMRPLATIFFTSLTKSRDMLHRGSSVEEVKKYVEYSFKGKPELSLEYFEVVDTERFMLVDRVRDKNNTALCIAGYINNIRLIDNVMYI